MSNETFDKIGNLISLSARAASYANGKQIADLYFEVFGVKVCGTCPKPLYAAFFQLKNYYLSHMDTRKYTLKDEYKYQFVNEKGQIRQQGYGGCLNTNTATDADIERYLSVYPQYAKMFDVAGEEPTEPEKENKPEPKKKTTRKKTA